MDQDQKLCVKTFRLLDKDRDNRISAEDLEYFFRTMYDVSPGTDYNRRAIIENLVSTREVALDYIELLDFIRENNLLHGHQSVTQLSRAMKRLQGTRFSFTASDLEAKMLDFGFEITQAEIEEVLELFTGTKDGDITGETLARLYSQVCLADLKY